MTRSKLDNRILFFAIFSVIFFPMKGIISFLSFYLFQADISSFSGTLILFIISPLIIYSILIILFVGLGYRLNTSSILLVNPAGGFGFGALKRSVISALMIVLL